MVSAPPLAFFGVSDTELMLVLAVILIFFGGKRMPELARGMGKALREIRRATGDVEREFRRVVDEAEHQTITPIKTAFETPAYVRPASIAAAAPVVSGATASAETSAERGPVSATGIDLVPPSGGASAEERAAPARSDATAPPSGPASHPQGAGHRWQAAEADEEFHSDI